MTDYTIPEEANEELLLKANEGHSTRELAEWLVETKQLESCSHTTVARHLNRLRLEAVAPPNATPELLARMLHANELFVDDVIDSLGELEEIAINGDKERKLAPNLAIAERVVRRRAQLIESKQKYLLKRLELAQREERQSLAERQMQEAVERLRRIEAPRNEPVQVEQEPGRNAPCYCGSGRKYKKCHGSAVTPAVTPAGMRPATAAASLTG